MKVCSVNGCGRASQSKGWCSAHYSRWKKTGDTRESEPIEPRGKGWVDGGYFRISVNGKKARVHVLIAEKALGRKLPPGAQVHHVDENKSNNVNSNLVICPSPQYHILLHTRTASLKACGHASWRRCIFCRVYDAPENLVIHLDGQAYHRKCSKISIAQKRAAKKAAALQAKDYKP